MRSTASYLVVSRQARVKVDQSLHIMVARVSTGGLSTLLRGRVPSRWLGYPFVVSTTLAIGLATWVEVRRGVGAPWLLIGAYGCFWFFTGMYALAWQVGSILRRMAALAVAMTLSLFLVWFHLDQAHVRREYLDASGPVAAGALPAAGHLEVHLTQAEPLQVVAGSLQLLAVALLAAHGLYLGWGGRAKPGATQVAPSLPRLTTEVALLDLPDDLDLPGPPR